MNLQQIEKKIDGFTLPVFPQMLVQMKKVTSNEHASVKDLAEIILKDQSLTSKILSVANSAYYGFYAKVSTITQAIIVLGFESVKNIALGLSVYNGLSSFVKTPSIQQFWEHSLATGVCAELLAEKLGYSPSEEALVAGLIHDVGKLLLVHLCPEEYREVEKVIAEHNAYSYVVEASLLGVTHAQAGELLTRKWGLPGSLTDVVAQHHKKEWGSSILTDIVAFSDFMIDVLASGKEPSRVEQLINMGSSVLNLKKESINNVIQVLAERLDEYSRIFEIRIENLMAYTTMVEEEYARLKKSTLAKDLSKQEEDLSIIAEISNALISGRPQDEILQMVMEGIIRIEGADVVFLSVVDHEHSMIRARFGLGRNVMEYSLGFSCSLQETKSIITQAISAGETRRYEKQRQGEDTGFVEDALLTRLGVNVACIVPLTMQQKKIGALILGWEADRPVRDENEMRIISMFANQASLVLGTMSAHDADRNKPKRKRSNLLLDLD